MLRVYHTCTSDLGRTILPTPTVLTANVPVDRYTCAAMGGSVYGSSTPGEWAQTCCVQKGTRTTCYPLKPSGGRAQRYRIPWGQ